MSKIEKLRKRLLEEPRDFTWSELAVVMKSFGYQLHHGSGSRRSFARLNGEDVLYLHQPHPREILKPYQVRLAIEHLRKERLL